MRQRPEENLHVSVARFLDVALMPPATWTTFPSGGGGRVRGARLKRMGLKAGWPDILIVAPGAQHFNVKLLGIELKTERGRASKEQKDVRASFAMCGALHTFCRSIDDVEQVLRANSIPIRATAGLRLVRQVSA